MININYIKLSELYVNYFLFQKCFYIASFLQFFVKNTCAYEEK